jgi:CheY-like chemotaxis protein
MSPLLLYDFELTEVQDAGSYNRRQVHRRIFAHDSLPAIPHVPDTQQVLHVLIVDEDRDAADSLAGLVCNWGHTVCSAYDGAAGLKLAAAQQPDVVLLGIGLTDLQGFATAQHLREGIGLSKCFIIALVSRSDGACRGQCLEAGIDLLLIKPIDAFVLETLLLLEGERLAGVHLRS